MRRIVLSLLLLTGAPALADTVTTFEIPRLTIPYCQGENEVLRAPSHPRIFRDEFPFSLRIRRTRIHPSPAEYLAMFLADPLAYTKSWDLEFFDTSFEEILTRLKAEFAVPQADLDQLTMMWKARLWDAGVSRGGFFQDERLDPRKRYDKLRLFTVMPAAGLRFGTIKQISQVTEPPDQCYDEWSRYWWIPFRTYIAMLSLHASNSYEIDISIPPNSTPETLARAARYLGALVGEETARTRLESARSAGAIPLTTFLPKEIRNVVNRFDTAGFDNCHSFALSTVDPLFRSLRSSHDDIPGLAEPAVRNLRYFDVVNSNAPVKLGDVIWITNQHSMVYLVGGYVLMKDNDGPQWLYRLAHLADLGRGDYLSYFPASQGCLMHNKDKDNMQIGLVAVGRRNATPFVPDASLADELCPKSECYENLKKGEHPICIKREPMATATVPKEETNSAGPAR